MFNLVLLVEHMLYDNGCGGLAGKGWGEDLRGDRQFWGVAAFECAPRTISSEMSS